MSNIAQSKSDEKLVSAKDIDIVRVEGNQIVLPKDMTIDEGITWLVRKKENEEKIITYNEVIECFPLEGAYAFYKVLQEKFGFTTLSDTPGFFGPQPPTMVAVAVDVDKTEQVPWGRINVPSFEGGWLGPSATIVDGKLCFVITGQGKRKYQDLVHELGERTREYIRMRSIYRGRAVRSSFPVSDDMADFNIQDCPRFMDLGSVSVNDLIFPEATRADVEINILTLIRHTAECRRAGIPIKRGVLLEGPYGVGKTMTANVTAKTCVENKWTFIYLNDVTELANAIHFAKAYQPAVIFAEDIDQVTDDKNDEDERNETLTDILNTIDGIDTKTLDVMVVLTTNHVERISKAFLRPGRLDAVVSVQAPDKKAAETLMRLYGRGLVSEGADLGPVADKLAGQIPAVIREVTERSKLAAIRNRGNADQIDSNDLGLAADSMLKHLSLLSEKKAQVENPAQAFAEALAEKTAEKAAEKIRGNGLAKEIASHINN